MAWLMIPFAILMIGVALFAILVPFVVALFIYNEYQISKRSKQATKKDWERLMTRLASKQQTS